MKAEKETRAGSMYSRPFRLAYGSVTPVSNAFFSSRARNHDCEEVGVLIGVTDPKWAATQLILLLSVAKLSANLSSTS